MPSVVLIVYTTAAYDLLNRFKIVLCYYFIWKEILCRLLWPLSFDTKSRLSSKRILTFLVRCFTAFLCFVTSCSVISHSGCFNLSSRDNNTCVTWLLHFALKNIMADFVSYVWTLISCFFLESQLSSDVVNSCRQLLLVAKAQSSSTLSFKVHSWFGVKWQLFSIA